MAGPLAPLVAHRHYIYVLGILAILGVRAGPLSEPVGTAAVGLVLLVMVGTYLAERLEDRAVASPLLLAVGAFGLVAGVGLSLSGTVAGLAFVAGGLLFVGRAITGGDRQ